MTVETTSRKTTQTMEIALVNYDFDFRALVSAPEDIKCIRQITDGAVNQTMTRVDEIPSPSDASDVLSYVVSISSDGIGGTVTVGWPSTSCTITIYRETTDKQESDYEDFNQFPAETVETDFDRRTMKSQETVESIDRTLRLPINSSVSAELPDPEANTFLGWNSDASAIENIAITVTSGTLTRASEAEAVAGTNNDNYMTPLRVSQATSTRSGTFPTIQVDTSATIALAFVGLSTIGTLSVTTKATIALADITTATIGTLSVTTAFTAPGATVQMVYTLSTVCLTGSTVIPIDDTIPQITEGDEFMTLQITPKKSSNILKIEVKLMCSSSIDAKIIGALFKDAVANSLCVASTFDNQSAAIQALSFTHIVQAGSTSAITFRVRAGLGASGTLTFNGESGSRIWGGSLESSIIITEIGT